MQTSLILIFILIISHSILSQNSERSKISADNNSLDKELTDYSFRKTIDTYQSIKDLLDSTSSLVSGCGAVNLAKGVHCSFKDLCKAIRKNSNGKYIYKNNKGEKIPNYRLYYKFKQAEKCLVNQAAENFVKKHPKSVHINNEVFNYQQSKQDLIDKVSRKGFEKEFLEFEKSILDFELNDNAVFEEKSISEAIEKAEKDSKVELPAEIKKAYIRTTRYLNRLRFGIKEEKFEYISKLNDKAKNEIRDKFRIIENPFVNTSLLTSDNKNRKDYLAQYKKGYENSLKVFKESQKSIIEILNERKEKSPSKKRQYDSMIKRIQTIKLGLPNPSSGMNRIETCEGPNAYYNSGSHEFYLCPQILQLPSASLKEIIAHELGHAIDPCILASPLRRDTFFEEEAYEVTQYILGGENIVAGAVAYKDFPERKVLKCLMSKNSLSARETDISKVKQELVDKIAEAEARGVKNESHRVRKKTLNNLDRIYDQFAGCEDLPGETQLGEGWSDWLAGEVLANDLKKLEKEDRLKYAFETSSFYLSVACGVRPENLEKKVDEYLEKMNCSSKKSSDSNDDLDKVYTFQMVSEIGRTKLDEHSSVVRRFDKLLLANPTIRKSLGCPARSGGKYCN